MASGRTRRGVLPGFGLSMGFTLTYLSVIVLLPLSTLVWKSAGLTWAQFWRTATGPRELAAYRLSFGAALGAAAINLLFGLLLAWVLERYEFPAKRLVVISELENITIKYFLKYGK